MTNHLPDMSTQTSSYYLGLEACCSNVGAVSNSRLFNRFQVPFCHHNGINPISLYPTIDNLTGNK